MSGANTFEDVFVNSRVLSVQTQVEYLHAKCMEIFRYQDLPLTLPKDQLERRLIINGEAVVYEHEGELFVTDDAPNRDEDVYGQARRITISHRSANGHTTLERTIGKDAVLVRNDSERVGLDPLLYEYATLRAQFKITALRSLVDLRSHYIIQAKDEASYKSAVEYENAIRRGDTAVILAEEFDAMEGLTVHQTPISNNPATQAIELFQYISSQFYSELGITLNNNMKSQYVSDSELEKSTGMPLITNMLACRQRAVAEINALFGLEVAVGLSEVWDDEMEEDNEEPDSGTPEAEDSGAAAESTEGAGSTAGEAEPEAPEEATVEAPSEEPGGDVEAEVGEIEREELIDATEALLDEN